MMQQNLPQERIFQEQQMLLAQKFKFEKNTSSAYYTAELSENMINCPSEHYICYGKLLLEYDPNLISKLLAYLTPRRMNIVLLKKNSTIVFDRIENWYGTKYAVEGEQ
jgi:secreted Zn-dependent insulinase-like peptidase